MVSGCRRAYICSRIVVAVLKREFHNLELRLLNLVLVFYLILMNITLIAGSFG